jgi:hypothetical protein
MECTLNSVCLPRYFLSAHSLRNGELPFAPATQITTLRNIVLSHAAAQVRAQNANLRGAGEMTGRVHFK